MAESFLHDRSKADFRNRRHSSSKRNGYSEEAQLLDESTVIVRNASFVMCLDDTYGWFERARSQSENNFASGCPIAVSCWVK